MARYGDACNLFDVGPDELERKIEILRGHCADAGRDPSEIDITITSGGDVLGDQDGFLEKMRTYAGLGVGQVWLSLPPEDPTGFVEGVCDQVLPELSKL